MNEVHPAFSLMGFPDDSYQVTLNLKRKKKGRKDQILPTLTYFVNVIMICRHYFNNLNKPQNNLDSRMLQHFRGNRSIMIWMTEPSSTFSPKNARWRWRNEGWRSSIRICNLWVRRSWTLALLFIRSDWNTLDQWNTRGTESFGSRSMLAVMQSTEWSVYSTELQQDFDHV